MGILALHPYNKNQYRKYPLKQGAALRADNGYVVPDDIIVACSITSIYGKHRLYVKQIYYKAPVLKITIASVLDDEVLGAFTGDVLSDYVDLILTPYTRFISGTITIGSINSVQSIDSVLNFLNPVDFPGSEFEESTIFCYTPPAVHSIRDAQNNETRGDVAFGTLTNVSRSTVVSGTELTALSPETVFNTADKASYLGNCLTVPIKNINGVYPYASGEGDVEDDGNLFIVGVKPVIFYGESTQRGAIQITTPGITLDSLCTLKHKLLPPVDVSSFTLPTEEYKNLYYNKPGLAASPSSTPARPERLAGNFGLARRPEYYYWPQFVKEEYYAYWNISAPSVPVLLSLTPISSGFEISFAPPVNSGLVDIDYYEYSLNATESYARVTSQSSSTVLTITGLNSSTLYGVRIRAVNLVGTAGASSNKLTGTTLA